MAGKTREEIERYRDCIHVQSIGQEILMTDPACPRAGMCLGTFTCMKTACINCRSRAPKTTKEAEKEKGGN